MTLASSLFPGFGSGGSGNHLAKQQLSTGGSPSQIDVSSGRNALKQLAQLPTSVSEQDVLKAARMAGSSKASVANVKEISRYRQQIADQAIELVKEQVAYSRAMQQKEVTFQREMSKHNQSTMQHGRAIDTNQQYLDGYTKAYGEAMNAFQF